MEKNYITPVGLKRIQDEIHQLNNIERPEITRLVQWAVGNGDRSENADYLYGKRRLREIDKRVRFLLSRLEHMEVVDNSHQTHPKIQFGATVIIEDDVGEKKTFTVVGIDEVNIEKNYISWKSPIGRSLIGKSIDDVVKCQTPSGEKEYTILEFKYETIT